MQRQRMNSEHERHPRDFYPTPPALALAALKLVEPSMIMSEPIRSICDPGCGTGVWGKAARQLWPGATITGIDIEPHVHASKTYNRVIRANYLEMLLTVPAKLVMGNPPYRLAEEFVRVGWDSLLPFGILIYLLRLEFLASAVRGVGLWQELPPARVVVLSQRPSFTGDGRTDAMEYALFIWQKNVKGKPELDWLMWR